MNAGRETAPLQDWGMTVVTDDFNQSLNTNIWTLTVPESGTGVPVNGSLPLTPSDASVAANDEAYLLGPKVFKPAANLPIYGRMRGNFSEVVAGNSAVFFGFASTLVANFIVNGGVSLVATGSFFGLFKPTGQTTWALATQNQSGPVITQGINAAGNGKKQLLEVFVTPDDTLRFKISAKINGEFLRDSKQRTIEQYLNFASIDWVGIGAGIKLSANTNNDVLTLEKILGQQPTGREWDIV